MPRTAPFPYTYVYIAFAISRARPLPNLCTPVRWFKPPLPALRPGLRGSETSRWARGCARHPARGCSTGLGGCPVGRARAGSVRGCRLLAPCTTSEHRCVWTTRARRRRERALRASLGAPPPRSHPSRPAMRTCLALGGWLVRKFHLPRLTRREPEFFGAHAVCAHFRRRSVRAVPHSSRWNTVRSHRVPHSRHQHTHAALPHSALAHTCNRAVHAYPVLPCPARSTH